MGKVTVRQNPEKEVPTEVLAESIKAISDGMKKIRNGLLNDKAILVLLQHNIPTDANGKRMSLSDIKDVLNGLESLSATYLKKK